MPAWLRLESRFLLSSEKPTKSASEPRAVLPLVVTRQACVDYACSSRLEWLETNGTGGFAMGTVAGSNTRRYHGVLIAALPPPAERHLLLAKLDESVTVDGVETALATNQYPGVLHPDGFRHLVEFRLDPFPTWVFSLGQTQIEKRLFLVHGEQTAVVTYRANRPCHLQVRPYLAYRGYHSLTRSNAALNTSVLEQAGPSCRSLRIRPYAQLPEMHMHFNGVLFEQNGGWYYNFEYLEELDRGLDYREDLYRIGDLGFALHPATDAWFIATIEGSRENCSMDVAHLEASERSRRRSPLTDTFASRLFLAADQFRVRRADGSPTVFAGYPWFTDWGRDTMIALPGLLIARGYLDEARQVIQGFLRHLDQGIIPNRFADGEARPEYNTADATLWMFQAAQAYLRADGDPDFIRQEFYPAAREILLWHERGTHSIQVDKADRLLAAGDEGTQLTWMDAAVNGRPVTSRHGKPVEVNALYYNALCLMAEWARNFGQSREASEYEQEASTVKSSFVKAFWNEARGCLYDVIAPSGADQRIRPNQIFAVSLPFPLLSSPQARSVVGVVEAELMTPMGLRTLARGEPGYQPRYQGGPEQRDASYHQGVIWPWLIGPFIDAYLRAFGTTPETLAHCRGLLRGLEAHLSAGCLGTVAEIFEAEPPYRAVGAPAQAWSVAEVLRVLTARLRDAKPLPNVQSSL